MSAFCMWRVQNLHTFFSKFLFKIVFFYQNGLIKQKNFSYAQSDWGLNSESTGDLQTKKIWIISLVSLATNKKDIEVGTCSLLGYTSTKVQHVFIYANYHLFHRCFCKFLIIILRTLINFKYVKTWQLFARLIGQLNRATLKFLVWKQYTQTTNKP